MLKVILIDDERPALNAFERLLQEYENIQIVGQFTDIFEAFEMIQNNSVDVVFLDIEMPKMKGIEAAEKILEIDNHVQIIFVTAYSDYAMDAFEVNAIDYIVKPVLKRRLDKTLERIEKNFLLKKTLDQLTQTSITDCLTGLYNRRYMIERIEEEIARYNRNKKAFSLIISDIDFFKKVNDTYGHDCGDFVLKEVVQIMLKVIRKQDIVARWGGEEFLILLPETNLEGAKLLAERMRKEVEIHIMDYDNKKLSVTMTFGVSAYDGNEGTDGCIKRADHALYKGKEKGRNCVVVCNYVL